MGLGEVAPKAKKCVINKDTRDSLTLPKDSCLCTVRLGLISGSKEYIEIPVLLDPGSCYRALIDQHTAHQLIHMGIPKEQLSPTHLTISGYDGGSHQRISSQISPVLSVPGTRFHDPSIPMSIVELSTGLTEPSSGGHTSKTSTSPSMATVHLLILPNARTRILSPTSLQQNQFPCSGCSAW